MYYINVLLKINSVGSSSRQGKIREYDKIKNSLLQQETTAECWEALGRAYQKANNNGEAKICYDKMFTIFNQSNTTGYDEWFKLGKLYEEIRHIVGEQACLNYGFYLLNNQTEDRQNTVVAAPPPPLPSLEEEEKEEEKEEDDENHNKDTFSDGGFFSLGEEDEGSYDKDTPSSVVAPPPVVTFPSLQFPDEEEEENHSKDKVSLPSLIDSLKEQLPIREQKAKKKRILKTKESLNDMRNLDAGGGNINKLFSNVLALCLPWKYLEDSIGKFSKTHRVDEKALLN